MNLTWMTATGTTGFLILVAANTFRGCSAGHAPSALLSGFILGILSVEVWAIAPTQFGLNQNYFRYVLGWVIAIAPFALLARGFIFHRRAIEREQKNTQAVPSDGHKPPSRVPSDGPTTPADAH